MASIVNVHQAKTNLSKLLERAHNGEEIILAKAGKPYARLVPLEGTAEGRKLDALKGKLPPIDDSAFFDPLPEDELRAWETTGWEKAAEKATEV
jgi:prevent-host-death family protein